METIKIPPIPGPWQQLCYAPEPLDTGMARCDRVKGHGGKHTWELVDQIAARVMIVPCRQCGEECPQWSVLSSFPVCQICRGFTERALKAAESQLTALQQERDEVIQSREAFKAFAHGRDVLKTINEEQK